MLAPTKGPNVYFLELGRNDHLLECCAAEEDFFADLRQAWSNQIDTRGIKETFVEKTDIRKLISILVELQYILLKVFLHLEQNNCDWVPANADCKIPTSSSLTTFRSS